MRSVCGMRSKNKRNSICVFFGSRQGTFVMSCGVNTCVLSFWLYLFLLLLLAQDIFVIFWLFLLSFFFWFLGFLRGKGDERCMNMTPNTIYLLPSMTRECYWLRILQNGLLSASWWWSSVPDLQTLFLESRRSLDPESHRLFSCKYSLELNLTALEAKATKTFSWCHHLSPLHRETNQLLYHPAEQQSSNPPFASLKGPPPDLPRSTKVVGGINRHTPPTFRRAAD